MQKNYLKPDIELLCIQSSQLVCTSPDANASIGNVTEENGNWDSEISF